jgi:nitrate reductase NapE component
MLRHQWRLVVVLYRDGLVGQQQRLHLEREEPARQRWEPYLLLELALLPLAASLVLAVGQMLFLLQFLIADPFDGLR